MARWQPRAVPGLGCRKDVFVRDRDQIRHAWATELMFAPRDGSEEPRHVDSIWPIWNVLDVTPEGRGNQPNFPALRYAH